MVAELEEVVAQRGDVHVRGHADGDLRREHVGAGLHRPVARAVQALDGDALAVEEVGELEQDAGLVGRHHFDDVRQQVRLHGLGAGAIPHQLQVFLALEPGQHGFELGH